MQDRRWKSFPALLQQILFNRRLLNPILAERFSRLSFYCRHFGARSVNPNRAATQKMPHLAPERLDHLSRALDGEADHIDDQVWIQRRYARTKLTLSLSGFPVQVHELD